MLSRETNAGQLQILVVEDALEDFILIEHELRRAGLKFHSTRIETTDGLSRELDRGPQLVLCDHGNAQIDSFRVLEVVRARSDSLPFIVVTGSMREAQIADAVTRGADDVVLKHRLSELVPAVHRALRHGEARRRLAESEHERERLRAELEAWRFGHARAPNPLPICAGCKKIRDSGNEWIQLESYLHNHLNIRFTHGLCFDCVQAYTDRKE